MQTNLPRPNLAASVWYGIHELESELTQLLLELFRHLSTIFASRKRIATIHLCYFTKPNMVDDHKWFIYCEDKHSTVRSGDAAHMIAQYSFHYQALIVRSEWRFCYRTFIISEQTSILKALDLSGLPDSVTSIHFWMEGFHNARQMRF